MLLRTNRICSKNSNNLVPIRNESLSFHLQLKQNLKHSNGMSLTLSISIKQMAVYTQVRSLPVPFIIFVQLHTASMTSRAEIVSNVRITFPLYSCFHYSCLCKASQIYVRQIQKVNPALISGTKEDTQILPWK